MIRTIKRRPAWVWICPVRMYLWTDKPRLDI